MTQSLTLLACQIHIPPTPTAAARDAHLAATAAKIDAALTAQPADLVVLPELASIDYSREAFGALDEVAEPLDGASFQVWRDLAQRHKTHISYGFARRDGAQFQICVAVVGPDGRLLGHYDKLHLAQYGASMEKDYFTRGAHLFTYRVNGFTIAPIICYDIRIPELSRTLALDHGADLITHCGAYYRDSSFATWHPFATTRALENQLFFLSLNRAGTQYGNSRMCWPWMDDTTAPVAFPEHDEQLQHITLTRAMQDNARRDYTFLQDRLPDYQTLRRIP